MTGGGDGAGEEGRTPDLNAWQAQKAPEKMKKTLLNQPPHSSPFPTFPAKSEKFFTSVRPNVLCLQSRASLYDNILIDEI
jgi:hypothetical protein